MKKPGVYEQKALRNSLVRPYAKVDVVVGLAPVH